MRVSVSRSSSGSPSEAWQETMRRPRSVSIGDVRDVFEAWVTLSLFLMLRFDLAAMLGTSLSGGL